ncbi:MAG: hydroxymethylbilane synthase [Akkermansiaceae bacterium]|nr:hydroxymethylbilane synthase [Akkermansiaceae bacterium]
MKTLRIGTRGSALALKQAEMTEAALAEAFPDLKIERVVITTTGDRRTDVALNEVAKAEGVWDKGVFIKELEVALENDEIDVAVHSLKDLPTVLEDHLELRAVLERAPVADAWIGKIPWSEAGEGTRVGTSSVRRARQLEDVRPGLVTVDLRGNVPTRLRKCAEEESLDGIMLAEAGLRRLGYSVEGVLEIEGHSLHVECLSEKEFFPAAGQGAVGLEIRRGDSEAAEIIDALNHQETWTRITAERNFLHLLDAGCSTPIGVWSALNEGGLSMGARVYPEDGGTPQRAEASGSDPLGVAEELFKNLS